MGWFLEVSVHDFARSEGWEERRRIWAGVFGHGAPTDVNLVSQALAYRWTGNHSQTIAWIDNRKGAQQ